MGKKGALQPPGGTGRTKEVLMADTELQGMLGAVTLDIDYHGQLLGKLQHKWWSERLETEAEAEQRAAKFIASPAWARRRKTPCLCSGTAACMAHKLSGWEMESRETKGIGGGWFAPRLTTCWRPICFTQTTQAVSCALSRA